VVTESATRIAVLGATGFTGGAFLRHIGRRYPTWRVSALVRREPTWDEDVAYQVASAMASHRKDERLRQLTDSLRKQWRVDVNESRVAELIEAEEMS
jgi:nucleoside-diphosphate-sugar epimerase